MAVATHLSLALRASTDADREFLYNVYASTRQEELAASSWSPETVDAFLRDQFRLQDIHYRQYYPQAQFQVVLVDGEPAGRLYTQFQNDGVRLLDIALLPDFRRRGVGGILMRDLIAQADARGLPLSLHVEFNNPVQVWYQRLGFRGNPADGVYLFMERPAPKASA